MALPVILIEPTRLAVTIYLARRTRGALAREIEAEFGIKTRSLVAYHLKELRKVGAVRVKR